MRKRRISERFSGLPKLHVVGPELNSLSILPPKPVILSNSGLDHLKKERSYAFTMNENGMLSSWLAKQERVSPTSLCCAMLHTYHEPDTMLELQIGQWIGIMGGHLRGGGWQAKSGELQGHGGSGAQCQHGEGHGDMGEPCQALMQ